jgi:predicted permease
MRLFAALYRLGLYLTSVDYRRRYGQEALDVACQRVANCRGLARWRVALRELVDLLITARRDRRAERSSRQGLCPSYPAYPTYPSYPLAGVALDVRDAIRSLRATPGFTAIALVVLTLGIGASTAIFSVVDAVVLRGLPFDEADRIMQIGRLSAPGARPGVETAQTFFDWRGQQDAFDELAASAGASMAIVEGGVGEPEAINARRVTANLFRVLRVAPAAGRAFTEDDEIEGRPRVAIIGDGLWRRRFGADPDVLGRTLRTETAAWTIVGVMPRGFSYPYGPVKPVDVWIPFVPTASDRTRNAGRNFTWTVIGRLKPSYSLAQAEAQMQGITTGLARRDPAWFREAETTGVMPLGDALVRNVRDWMMLLIGAVALVLLVACVNVANLMLTRALSRRREVALRTALGGTRWRLARARLVESLVLSTIGTALGLVVAHWSVAVLKASMPQGVPRLSSIAIDGRVLFAAAIAAAVTGIVFGTIPAILGSRADLAGSLKEGGRTGSTGAPGRRLRAGLVVAEVTIAAVLLVGAGLFVASFTRFARVDLGFDLRDVHTFDAYLSSRDPDWRARGRPFVAEILERLQRIPGVDAAAAVVNGVPLTGSWNRAPISGPGVRTAADAEGILQRFVTPDYFRVLRVPLRRGRVFTEQDRAGGESVALISDVAERIYFAGEDAIGRTVTVDKIDRTIVGVVGGIRTNGPESDVWPELYMPVAQSEVLGAEFVVRSTLEPAAVRAAASAAVRAVRPEQVIREFQTMQGFFDVYAARPKFTMQLLALFGILAIVITAAGIYGVMAFLVAQQTREIGIRMALGALPGQVLTRVIGRAAAYVGIGLALGIAAASALSRFAGAFLFQIGARDTAVYAIVVTVMMVVGVAAAGIPARRAARVDPLDALRVE